MNINKLIFMSDVYAIACALFGFVLAFIGLRKEKLVYRLFFSILLAVMSSGVIWIKVAILKWLFS